MEPFEVGKTYRTRGGWTAKVTKILADTQLTYRILADHGNGYASHAIDGRSNANSDNARDLLPGAIEDKAKPDAGKEARLQAFEEAAKHVERLQRQYEACIEDGRTSERMKQACSHSVIALGLAASFIRAASKDHT